MILIVVSTGHFDPLIRECARLYPKYDFFGQIGSSAVVPPFPHLKVASPVEIERRVREAELVISHGGAGMTAMLNRLQKKNVIIPKQKRYGEANDLQVELARKWGELGMTELCMDVEKLEQAILNCRARSYTFASFPSLGQHLLKTLNFSSPADRRLSSVSGYGG